MPLSWFIPLQMLECPENNIFQSLSLPKARRFFSEVNRCLQTLMGSGSARGGPIHVSTGGAWGSYAFWWSIFPELMYHCHNPYENLGSHWRWQCQDSVIVCTSWQSLTCFQSVPEWVWTDQVLPRFLSNWAMQHWGCSLIMGWLIQAANTEVLGSRRREEKSYSWMSWTAKITFNITISPLFEFCNQSILMDLFFPIFILEGGVCSYSAQPREWWDAGWYRWVDHKGQAHWS